MLKLTYIVDVHALHCLHFLDCPPCAALKSQLESAEQRLDAERRAHQSTKSAAQAREAELEAQLTGSASALADMQHALDEAGMRSRGAAWKGEHEAGHPHRCQWQTDPHVPHLCLLLSKSDTACRS